jgi:hypothetical protein
VVTVATRFALLVGIVLLAASLLAQVTGTIPRIPPSEAFPSLPRLGSIVGAVLLLACGLIHVHRRARGAGP